MNILSNDDFIAADCEATYALIPMGSACARVGRRELRRVLTAHRRATETPLRETIDKLHRALLDSEKCREDNAKEKLSLRAEVERLTAANHDLLDSLQATVEALVQAESEQPVVAAPVGSYVPTGEVREAAVGEYALGTQGPHLCRAPTGEKYPIYRRIEPGEHGAFTHVLRFVGENVGATRGQIVQASGNWLVQLITDSDAEAKFKSVYDLIPLAPAAPQAKDDGFEKWHKDFCPSAPESAARALWPFWNLRRERNEQSA